jgi:hypothetical protein
MRDKETNTTIAPRLAKTFFLSGEFGQQQNNTTISHTFYPMIVQQYKPRRNMACNKKNDEN